MPTAEMLKQIWIELRHVRATLETHATENSKDIKEVKSDIAGVKDQLTGQKVKIGLLLSGIGAAMTGLVAWVVNHVDNVPK